MNEDNIELSGGAAAGAKCAVDGCPNTTDQGEFVGTLCFPCHNFVSGRGDRAMSSQAYRNAVDFAVKAVRSYANREGDVLPALDMAMQDAFLDKEGRQGEINKLEALRARLLKGADAERTSASAWVDLEGVVKCRPGAVGVESGSRSSGFGGLGELLDELSSRTFTVPGALGDQQVPVQCLTFDAVATTLARYVPPSSSPNPELCSVGLALGMSAERAGDVECVLGAVRAKNNRTSELRRTLDEYAETIRRQAHAPGTEEDYRKIADDRSREINQLRNELDDATSRAGTYQRLLYVISDAARYFLINDGVMCGNSSTEELAAMLRARPSLRPTVAGSLDVLQAAVGEFHDKFGAAVGDRPGLWHQQLRAELIREEAMETFGAIRAGDLVGAADGLCDLIYVCLGAAVTFGMRLGPIFEAVHSSNMAKEGGGTRADGKILKPVGWTPPDVAGLLRKQGWNPEIFVGESVVADSSPGVCIGHRTDAEQSSDVGISVTNEMTKDGNNE